MKKIILIFALALFTTSVWAQETHEKTMPKKPSNAGFVTNGFWDNWEISIGGGIGTAFSSKPDPGAQHKRWGYELNFGLTKWVTPVFGGRLQLQGGEFDNFFNTTGSKHHMPYVFVHTDLMVNFSNWVGGYRDDRAYYAIPFVGAGYMATNITDDSRVDSKFGHAFAFSFGLLNKFRISPAFDFNIELKSLMVPTEKVSSDVMAGPYTFGMSATVGFTYRFNTRTFQRGAAGYTMDDIAAFQQAVADAQAALDDANAQNASLADQLAAAKAAADKAAAEAAAAKAAQKPVTVAAAPSEQIFYDLNASKLTSKDKTRLQLVAEMIKSGASDKTYTIVGHADKETGTAAINQKLSDKRAKSVYDYLVSQGVNADQLTYEGKGDTANPYDVQKANRVAIIK